MKQKEIDELKEGLLDADFPEILLLLPMVVVWYIYRVWCFDKEELLRGKR